MAPQLPANQAAQTIALSTAERSYLHTSLALTPPIRPDGRAPTQFRPLTAELDILPSTYGSSRAVWPDGGECIVGVKAEVEKGEPEQQQRQQQRRVEVSVEVAGARDDDPLAVFLGCCVSDALGRKLAARLDIADRWHWKLYIDVVLLAPPVSHPSTLLSLAVHLALRATRLPRLLSAADEDPLFGDDWDAALPLYPPAAADLPAVTLLAAAVATNVLFDPTRDEMAVADCVLAVSVAPDGRVVGLRTLDGGTASEGGVGRHLMASVVRQCGPVARDVFAALEGIVMAAAAPP